MKLPVPRGRVRRQAEFSSGKNGDGIRVALADLPELLSTVMRRALEAEKDFIIVEDLGSPATLVELTVRQVDVIVTAKPEGELAPPFRAALFGPRPIPVVAVSPDGSHIDVYSRSSTFGFGLKGLVELIREADAGSRPRSGD